MRILQTIALLIVVSASFAQTKTMKIWKGGTYTSYSVENIDSITFSDSILNVEPQDVIVEERFWKSEDDVVSVFSSAYQYFQGFLNAEKSLEIALVNGTGDRISPTNSLINTAWSMGYNAITRTNMLVDNIGNVDMTTSDKEEYILHAKCLRAVIYYMMTQLWGNIPYIIHYNSDDLSPSATSHDEIIQNCYSCLRENYSNIHDFKSGASFFSSKNIIPLMNEISFYVTGGSMIKNVSITDMIVPMPNGDEQYILVDNTYNNLLITEAERLNSISDMADSWKNAMPRYGAWNAMKRLGQAISQNGLAASLLLPIPDEEVRCNNNLSQNVGY